MPQTVLEPVIKQVRPEDRGVEVDIYVPADLFYFDGHFPGDPILPGVVQIDWVVALADRYLGLNIESAQEFRVKFRSVIQPESSLTIALKYSHENRALSFDLRNEALILSSGSIRLRDA